MPSLTTHLRQRGDHGRLAFHPECPVCCRERLAGALPHDAVVGRRTQALLAAGVVAVWSASPTAVRAAEPDQEEAAPDQVVAEDAPSEPTFDPGGPSTDAPDAVEPAPGAEVPGDLSDDDAIPVEQEPTTEEIVPTANPGAETEATELPQEAPPAVDPVTAAPGTPAAPASPPPSAPEPNTSPPEVISSAPAENAPAPDDNEASESPRAHEHDGKQNRPAPSHAVAPPVVSTPPAPQPQPVAPVTYASAPPASATTNAEPAATISSVRHERRARRDDRVHVVQRNESLWSIAKDVLGDDASPARIAREVNRLWELNGSRIGTGDPDLLMAGTKLVLR
jgi:hypothetical protein